MFGYSNSPKILGFELISLVYPMKLKKVVPDPYLTILPLTPDNLPELCNSRVTGSVGTMWNFTLV